MLQCRRHPSETPRQTLSYIHESWAIQPAANEYGHAIMNRTMAYGETVLGRADKPATVSKATGFRAALERFRAGRRRAAERTALVDQLYALDGRMLSDIGVARGQIGEVATKSVGETTGLALAIARFVADVAVRPLVAMHGRHVATLEGAGTGQVECRAGIVSRAPSAWSSYQKAS